MEKRWAFFNILVTGLLLTIVIIFYAVLHGANPVTAQSGSSDEGGGQSGFPSFTSDENTPIPLSRDQLSPAALPTPVPGNTKVYFVPSDNDATATVLYLYNTGPDAQVVFLRGFSYDGVLVYSLDININGESFLRLASDSIASSPPPSWATPAPLITNFTDFTYFASLSLPPGVKVEGYTVFNPGTGVVDPRADQGAIPLTFNSEPPATNQP